MSYTGESLVSSEREGMVNTLDVLNAASYLSTPESRGVFFRGLDFEDFTNLLTIINESCRLDYSEISGSNEYDGRMIFRTIIDEETGKEKERWPLYLAPLPQHRRPLLKEAFTVAKGLDDLEQAATLLGLSISAIHPFKDGNGRTSRILYGMLAHGYNGEDSDREYFRKLSSHDGRDIIYFSPENANLCGLFVTREMRSGDLFDEHRQLIDLRPQRGANMAWKWRGLWLGNTALDSILEEGYFSIPLLMSKIREDERQVRDCSTSTTSTSGKEVLILQVDKVYPRPRDVDKKQIHDDHTRLKTHYIRAIIDCFRPEVQEPLAGAAELTEIYRPTVYTDSMLYGQKDIADQRDYYFDPI